MFGDFLLLDLGWLPLLFDGLITLRLSRVCDFVRVPLVADHLLPVLHPALEAIASTRVSSLVNVLWLLHFILIIVYTITLYPMDLYSSFLAFLMKRQK